MKIYSKDYNPATGMLVFEYNFNVMMIDGVELTVEQYQEITQMIEDKIESYGEE